MNLKFIVITIVIFVGGVCFFTLSNRKTLNIKVNQVDKIENTTGSKDGFTTEIYYLVYTDKGAFRINISGLVAHPELAGALKKDSIYDITVCGIEVPFAGIYRNVVDVINK